jgi:phospholipid-translocating P-type ATPase (flippase)
MKYKEATTSPDKDSLLEKLNSEIEKDFSLAGVTAIEDKLQEGVPETIELLLKSGIRLWVLTGDKKETALIIGKTCRLIEEIGRNDIDLTDGAIRKRCSFLESLTFESAQYLNSKKVIIKEKLDEVLKTFHIGHLNDLQSLMEVVLEEQFYMIVDGETLIDIIKCPELSLKFFKVGILCRSVICCRVTPGQKSQVVDLAKKFGNWVTLAVGDGANDVSMIMSANIGVGIQGKEGTQAVRSADYALCQFRFLQRLILVHGRNGYRRISTFICYYFYKNIILVFAEIYFVFFSGFSGQLFFPDILSILYNSLWTSWPCIFAYSIDKDLQNESTLSIDKMKYKNNLLGKFYEIVPTLYYAGQKGIYFNMKVFWTWLVYSIIHGGLCFIGVTLGLRYQSPFNDGKMIDHWWFTTLIFTMVVHVVTYKIFVELDYWNYLVLSTSIGSVVFYYFSILVIDLPYVSKYIQNELTLKVISMLSTTSFWMYVVTLPTLCIIIDITFKFFGMFYKPNPVQIIQSEHFAKGNDDVNVLKKLSVIMDPKELYMFRKTGQTPRKKTVQGRGFHFTEEKDINVNKTKVEMGNISNSK